MTKSDKIKIVEQLSSEFSSCDAIVICEYKGLSVKKLESLRSLAKEHNVRVKVVKNTLASLALNNANKQGLVFKDTNIFLWSSDQLAVSKVASKFAEKNDIFKIKTAYIDGSVVGVDRVEALSKLPSRDELIAMLLQVWNAPLQNFVIGLNALKNKKEEE